MRKLLYLVLSLCLGSHAFALTNWYVKPSSTGSGSGADWTNAVALSSLNWASVAAGDNIWVSGGTYGALNVPSGYNTGASSVTQFLRPRTTDAVPIAAAGWSAAFDSKIILTNISLPRASWLSISGRIADGIEITTSSTGGSAVTGSTAGTCDHLTFSWIKIIGTTNTTGLVVGNYGFNLANVNGLTNTTFQNCIVKDTCEAFRAYNWNNVVLNKVEIDGTHTDNIDHEDIMYSYPTRNVTVKNCNIHGTTSDGFFFEFGTNPANPGGIAGAYNFQMYGNVFWNCTNHLFCTKDDGSGGGFYGPIKIYNNTFAAPSTSNFAYITYNNSTWASGSEVKNNVFFNVANDTDNEIGNTNSGYNAYNYTTLNGFGWPSGDVGSFTFTGSPFVSITTGDAHQTAGSTTLKDLGLFLGSPWNVDPAGVTRSNPPDVGAYEQ